MMKSPSEIQSRAVETDPEEEAAWLEAIARGDGASFQKLHARFKGIVFNTIYKVLNDQQDSEDTLQEVFAHIWQKADMFVAGKGKALTWITTMARNRAIDRLRSKQRRARLRDSYGEENFVDAEPAAHCSMDAIYENERYRMLRSAVLELSRDQREAIELAYFSGLTQNEVAERLGEPLGTIKARIRRGMHKLETKVKTQW